MLVPLALIDSAVVRVQIDMLPDQTLLELLISELDENTQRLHQDSDGVYRPIDTWESLGIDTNGLVSDFCSVQRYDQKWSGSLVPKYLPQSVKIVRIRLTYIDGTVDFAAFPQSLEALILENNRFSGSAALEELPASMGTIAISSNRFTGTIAFENLPPRLERLDVMNNGFTGKSPSKTSRKRFEHWILGSTCFQGKLSLATSQSRHGA